MSQNVTLLGNHVLEDVIANMRSHCSRMDLYSNMTCLLRRKCENRNTQGEDRDQSGEAVS